MPSSERAGNLPGLSILICCCNSASRLPETLRCIAEQDFPEGVPWEVIVVDNASTDETVEVAHAAWPADKRSLLRVLQEPKPGVANARQRGMREARYAFISFVDDDNRVPRDWARRVFERMSAAPQTGARGGTDSSRCEVVSPDGWKAFVNAFAFGR